jgi:ABC-type glycerol-3-phosphate transport system substrate-binding protein
MAQGLKRRHAVAGLAGLGFIAPARAADSVTWYISQFEAEQAEALGKAFTAAHPDITVDVVRVTGQVAFQRLQMDIKNKTPHCDVFSASDISHMAILKEKGELLRYEPQLYGNVLDAWLSETASRQRERQIAMDKAD